VRKSSQIACESNESYMHGLLGINDVGSSERRKRRSDSAFALVGILCQRSEHFGTKAVARTKKYSKGIVLSGR
jgi:hypothetical protein